MKTEKLTREEAIKVLSTPVDRVRPAFGSLPVILKYKDGTYDSFFLRDESDIDDLKLVVEKYHIEHKDGSDSKGYVISSEYDNVRFKEGMTLIVDSILPSLYEHASKNVFIETSSFRIGRIDEKDPFSHHL